jgi:hypothetical protein
MGDLLTHPSTESSLNLARSARLIQMKLGEKHKSGSSLARELHDDALNLHRAILLFEADPQMVDQNAMARIYSGLSPAILSFEEFLSGEDVNLWELVMDGTAVVTSIISSTPYVTTAKISLDFHFLDELVKVEERLVDLMATDTKNIEESTKRIADICDGLRKKNLKYSEKPGMVFVLWLSALMISYRNFRDNFKGK